MSILQLSPGPDRGFFLRVTWAPSTAAGSGELYCGRHSTPRFASWATTPMITGAISGTPARQSSPMARDIDAAPCAFSHSGMGFNKRKMGARRAEAAEKAAAARPATEAQILKDASRLVAAWNERQAKRMPMLFSPTIGCALKARHWFLWVRCPACHTTQAIDLRTLDRHPWSALTSLIPSLSCRSCRPHAPFAELVPLSDKSIADELRDEHTRGVLGE